MSTQNLPPWAQELKELFCSSAVSQFLIYGNIFDFVQYKETDSVSKFMPLKDFLEHIMLEGYDTVIFYDRGNGIRVAHGDKEWSEWLSSLNYGSLLEINTRDPSKALDLIDRYILRALNLQAIKSQAGEIYKNKFAIVIDFAQFIVPSGDSFQFANELGSQIVKILSWANDPAILNSNIATFLMTEKLNDVNKLIVENSYTAKIGINLPTVWEMGEYIRWLKATLFPNLEEQSDVGIDALARYMTGLSCVAVRKIIAFALKNNYRIKEDLLKRKKKESIEKECQDLLEFYEPAYTLDMVAGQEPVKEWLRQDTTLLRMGKFHALPMGYLICGRIGTGKTFLVQCWAGELGIPCVVLKNFRDKWVGTTESNLEKIFSILHALGEVVVFVDEADQITGKRDSGSSDGGLSGRVYAMLAKEMSDTKNRGKIIWVFATSRPDLLEIDLKRQGRLDVHIPLFNPQNKKEFRELFLSISKKLKFELKPGRYPDLPEGLDYGGNEIEGMMVRALRIYELEKEPKRLLPEIFGQVLKEVKPNANTKKLEYMDLVAVRECTDNRFLPARFLNIPAEEIEKKIDELRRFISA